MGLFQQLIRAIFGGNPSKGRASRQVTRRKETTGGGWSERDIQVVAESAQNMVRVVNESIQIANSTSSFETKESRIQVARQKLKQLAELRQRFPFVLLERLDEVEAALETLESGLEARDYSKLADSNQKGKELEKEGRVEEAIVVYERLLAKATDTPFTYRRLAILYRKRKELDSEMRVLDAACRAIPRSNPKHHQWFVDRREKLLDKAGE